MSLSMWAVTQNGELFHKNFPCSLIFKLGEKSQIRDRWCKIRQDFVQFPLYEAEDFTFGRGACACCVYPAFYWSNSNMRIYNIRELKKNY